MIRLASLASASSTASRCRRQGPTGWPSAPSTRRRRIAMLRSSGCAGARTAPSSRHSSMRRNERRYRPACSRPDLHAGTAPRPHSSTYDPHGRDVAAGPPRHPTWRPTVPRADPGLTALMSGRSRVFPSARSGPDAGRRAGCREPGGRYRVGGPLRVMLAHRRLGRGEQLVGATAPGPSANVCVRQQVALPCRHVGCARAICGLRVAADLDRAGRGSGASRCIDGYGVGCSGCQLP